MRENLSRSVMPFALALGLVGWGCDSGAEDPLGRIMRDAGPSEGHDAAPPSDSGSQDFGRLTCPGYEVRDGDCEDPATRAYLQARDSDQDGLTDYEEICVHGTDPCRIDTNDNGVSDLVMVAAGLDPTDPTQNIPSEDFALVLPYLDDPVERTLRFGTDIRFADIYFLIDTTGSMGGAITNVRSSLSTIASRLRDRIPDAQLGVGRFDDFPFGGYGSAGGSCMDVPFANEQDITSDLAAVQIALNSLAARCGADIPESQVEAIYQAATGAGGSWTYSGSSYSLPARVCPMAPDESVEPIGYPCFRPRALPVIVLVADATWHNDHLDRYAYSGITPPPARFDDAAAALTRIGGRFVGVAVRGGGLDSAQEMARRTGSVDERGDPLVFTSSDGSVSDDIVTGIERLVGQTPQDVGSRIENVPGNPDGFDARLFIKSIRPEQGYRDGIPGDGFASFDASTFYGVIPGTTVEFRVEFWNDVRPEGDRAEVFRARIFVVGNGVTDLDQREVYIVVPPDDTIILL